jgi:hypothetical protein
MNTRKAATYTDEELFGVALSALVLLVESGHDDDCRFKFSPVDECPTCAARHMDVGRQAIKALRRRVKAVKKPPQKAVE